MGPPQGMPPPPGMMPPPPAPPPPGGLLQPTPGRYGPPPMPNIPGLFPPGLRPTGMQLGAEQAIMFLRKAPKDDIPPDADQDAPSAIRPYLAGLRPTLRPVGADWQQEVVYEALGKTDREIEDAARYYFKIAQNYDHALSAERITASQYYSGAPFGDEDKGRSRLVMTVVRDTIRATLPSLLRIFTAVEDPVSFEPVANEIFGNDQVATQLARQATDYCRWALFQANNGWTVLHDCLLEALTRKAGWVRWSWGKREYPRTEVCEGLLLPQLQMLLAEPGIEAHRIVRRPMLQSEIQALQKTPDGAMYLQQGGPAEMWSARITRHTQQAWPHVEAVPAECVWIVSDAANVQQARGIFHVRDVPASDLIEMGLPADQVLRNTETLVRADQRQEAIARNQAAGYNLRGGPPGDKSMRLVRYAEGWIRLDADNDHRAELLHVHLLGDSTNLVQWERCDEIPLACFTPYREPGTVIGSSQADMVMDLQRIESRVMRAVLDSLGQSMFPRTVVTLGQANLADVRQTAIGSIIRVAQQGAVTELVRPFQGKEALPVLEVLEAVRESRTGITRASAGLTIDELQSTAPIAVAQQTANSQDRLDMVARTLAETGLAPLYVGLLKMLARQQDRPNVVRIRGQWLAIDPRALATMWEVSVNVGGRGTTMERLQMLAMIAAKQEQIIQTGGFSNPLVGIPEYRNTLARMLETANISDVSSYFRQLPPGFQPPPQPQQPNTDVLLAQVQQAKTAADTENDRAKQQTDRAKMLMDDDREREKAALDAWSRIFVAAAQYGSPVPALDELKGAMQSKAPALPMLADLPSPNSPQQPATSPNAPPKPQPGGPQPQPQRPAQPAGGPAPALPSMNPGGGGGADPATQAAVRNALRGNGGLPTAYGQIAQRAALAPLAGPGGPPLPPPGAGGPPPPQGGP